VTFLDVALFLALAAGAAPVLRRVGALPIVEIVGGLALLWGGVSALRSRPAPRRKKRRLEEVDARNAAGDFALGLAVAAGTPSYWIWWATAGLAFVEAARAHGSPGMAWMLGALVTGVVAWYIPLLWALHHGGTLLSPRAAMLVTRGMGVVLVALGVGLTTLGAIRF
jgi:threonine/homoserine/homoserine lactone efflux protein